MRQRALHAAAGATTADGHGAPPTNRADCQPTPDEVGLPASPTPDRGLVPTGTASTTPVDGPLAAVESQRFATVPLAHETAVSHDGTGTTLHATLTNEGEQPWAYRVPRGPAPFAGGHVADDEGDLRLHPPDDDGLFSDGVLRPGESVRSTLALSAVGGPDARMPRGEHAFQQPLRIWTEAATYGYNWAVTVVV